MYTRITVALVACVVLAGCAAPLTDGSPFDGGFGQSDGEDRLGWENGYAADDSLNVDQSDGLNETEREAFVARTMARVELVRQLEFEEPVPVEVISREEYRQQRGGATDPAYEAWNNQVWESLLLVGEDRNVSDVMDSVYGGSVLGYYSPSEDRIVIVSDSETPVIDRTTLAHELVHALQDQHFGLESGAATQDGQLARNGIVEGDARYTETLYEQRCGTEWDCVPRPNSGGGGGGDSGAPGVFLTIYTPYADGPQFVHELHQEGGWEAVDAVYEEKPQSTEQIIHPAKYPDERPVNVSVEDRSSEEWSRFDTRPVADTVGEASLYAMFWQNGHISRESLRNSPDEYSPYNYSHPATEGWAGDAVVPYESDDGEYGYVFESEWDSERDARQFADAYRATLTNRLGAQRVGDGVYRVPDDSSFGDAFRVRQEGTTVSVVNAPTTGQLDSVHASE
ncbi:Hvo_1808 family surface protein [Haloprofundus halophilus]|uniref:Hvo_1808 family surface protein n=1 Tax=Haloprofundus halophilus TaxID=2283527 RepID=UPI000E43C5C5|nr:Hvo_1808 family surface protein [Haloprofundus halophilus]